MAHVKFAQIAHKRQGHCKKTGIEPAGAVKKGGRSKISQHIDLNTSLGSGCQVKFALNIRTVDVIAHVLEWRPEFPVRNSLPDFREGVMLDVRYVEVLLHKAVLAAFGVI